MYLRNFPNEKLDRNLQAALNPRQIIVFYDRLAVAIFLSAIYLHLAPNLRLNGN